MLETKNKIDDFTENDVTGLYEYNEDPAEIIEDHQLLKTYCCMLSDSCNDRN